MKNGKLLKTLIEACETILQEKEPQNTDWVTNETLKMMRKRMIYKCMQHLAYKNKENDQRKKIVTK